MSTFTYQNWKKRGSEQRVINALDNGDKSYTELLDLTDLSKPILSERLKNLEKQGKIRSVAESKTKRFLYQLKHERLDDSEKARILLHNLSMVVLNYLEVFAGDRRISDGKYSQRMVEGINALLGYKMYEMIVTPLPEQEEWIKNFIGPEFAKRLPKLFFPENRAPLYIPENLSPRDQAIFKSKDAKEAATKLLQYLNQKWEKLTELE